MVAATEGARLRDACSMARTHHPWPTPCPSSASRCHSSRPISPRSTTISTACWCTRPCVLLDVRRDERVIDWFCGLGNFTLALARQAREVVGVEGSEALVMRSRENAKYNGLEAKARFEARNLFEIAPAELAAYGPADKWLVDPPREGAFALAKALADIAQQPDLAPGYIATAAHRVRLAATRRRWRATRACWSTRRAIATWPPVLSTCSRTQHTSKASRCSRSRKACQKRNRGPCGAPISSWNRCAYSRSPPKIPKRLSSDWNTL